MTPQQTDSLLQSAHQHQQSGRLREAESIYRQILESEPNQPRALFMMGILAQHRNDIPAAVDWLVKASIADPTFAESHFLLGVILHQRGELAGATQAYRRAIAHQPTHVKALNNLGRILLDQGQVSEGISILRNAIAIAPQHASAYSNLGDGLRMLRDFDGAIAEYQKAIAIQPSLAEAHSNMGAAFAERGQLTQGIKTLRNALSINPRLPSAHFNLARALQDQNQFDEAIHHCRKFIELRPDFADGHNLLGSLIGIGGDMPQAIAHQRRAIELKPGNAASASNLLLSLHYLDDITPAALFQAHLDWSTKYANHFQYPSPRGLAASAASSSSFSKDPIPIHTNDRNPNRKLRIGYVSPNFQSHSVAYFLESVLPAHDQSAVEIFCYADLVRPDKTTDRFRAMPVQWREITKLPDNAVSEMIRDDVIDILIDLAGHTADNRMILFAMKPAPIQITWLGYPNTTGLTTMDYRITDTIADSPGQSNAHHTEKLIRLDGSAWAYSPPPDSPPIGPLPAITNNYITFGSFNNLPKVTPTAIKTWSRILAKIPTSRLLIKAMGLTSKPGQNYIRTHLARNGINPARAQLLGWTPSTSSHLDLYNQIDIALDTFPYNGTTTTCEALWMGVPVITFPGQTHAARVGASLLTHAGLPEMIALDIEDYTKRAIELAHDQTQLTTWRTTLRDKLAHSPICDGLRMARQLEEVFQSAWRTWVNS